MNVLWFVACRSTLHWKLCFYPNADYVIKGRIYAEKKKRTLDFLVPLKPMGCPRHANVCSWSRKLTKQWRMKSSLSTHSFIDIQGSSTNTSASLYFLKRRKWIMYVRCTKLTKGDQSIQILPRWACPWGVSWMIVTLSLYSLILPGLIHANCMCLRSIASYSLDAYISMEVDIFTHSVSTTSKLHLCRTQ